MSKKLIIFIDSGDTLIDEATQVRDERGIVLRADFIPGAGEMLKTLHHCARRRRRVGIVSERVPGKRHGVLL